MTDSWKSLEGVTLADKFQLQDLLVENDASARFLVRMAGGPRPSGWLRLILSDCPAEGQELAQGQIAADLSHPNLAEVWEHGRTERGVTSMAYILTEPADDNLAAVLTERPLNQLEAREVLLSAARALSYLHARALVHGSLDPAAILAVGDETKLSSDTIAPSIDFAADLRALGDCIHAMFTQDPRTDLEHLSAIPQPFREIVRGCCGANPDEPWTARRVIDTLDPPAAPATPVVAVPVADEEPPEPAEPRRTPKVRIRFSPWVLVPVSAGAALVFMLLNKNPQPAGAAAAQTAERIVRVTNPAPPPVLPSPVGASARPALRQASDLAQSRIWRVVSYTYSKAEDTARMVGEINRKWPHLKAEQFSPNGSGPPYFVALGGRMTRSEAVRLQQRAISSGLPPDTFVRNFRK